MNDYISREAVINITAETGAWETQNHIRELPAVDVQPINQWISVKDKLPEEAVKVLIYTEYNATAYGFFTGAYYNNRPLFAITMNRNSEHSWYEEIRVSHWMPLPEPPQD